MGITSFENAAHDLGISVTKLAAVAPAASADNVPTATTTVAGTVLRAAAQVNSAAADTAGIVTDFNALLAKLRTAGILTT